MQLAFRVVLLSQGWALLSMALFVQCSLGLGRPLRAPKSLSNTNWLLLVFSPRLSSPSIWYYFLVFFPAVFGMEMGTRVVEASKGSFCLGLKTGY